MEVVALIGPPGTGKSDRALVVAYENHASCIIDDGILIYRNRLVAGVSAKKEASKVAAVRRAIFQDPKQVQDVKTALARIRPERILVLGTSDRMVIRITAALDLPEPTKYVHIEDIARPDEIKKANEARFKEGKHVIPVPTMELKPHFKGYLIDSLKLLRYRKKGKLSKRITNAEKSVVRPVFSYYGKLVFADKVFEELVKYALRNLKDTVHVTAVSGDKSNTQNNGLVLNLELEVHGEKKPEEIKKIVNQMRRLIQKEVEYTTGMFVETIRISLVTSISE